MFLLGAHLTLKGLVNGFSIGVGNIGNICGLLNGQTLLVDQAAQLHSLFVSEQGVLLDHSCFKLRCIFNILYFIYFAFY